METKTKQLKSARRERNRLYIWNFLKKNTCSHIDSLGEKCSQTNPIVLQFHHRNPAEKRNEVSRLVRWVYSIKTIKTEIDKCDVLCANHHLLITAKEGNYYKIRYK